MSTPLERYASLSIGTIESVSPSEFKVQLDTEAPQTTALNAGSPIAFPRLNSYVLVPAQGGAVVGQVTWIGVEKSPFPKRKGLKDFGLVDLPFPLRRMAVVPIGTLRIRTENTDKERLELERGVSLFPSVGDPVSLPTADQLKAIVEIPVDRAPVTIGKSALADSASIRVHPDALFGRHLAVLGNTGSGKSCSVAGVIRWTIEALGAARSQSGHSSASTGQTRRGARIVILDPNGEYKDAFKGLDADVRVLTPTPAPSGTANGSLVVPAWMWNAHEWASVLQAAPAAQQPILFEALRDLRLGHSTTRSRRDALATDLNAFAQRLRAICQTIEGGFGDFGARSDAQRRLRGVAATSTDLEAELQSQQDKDLAKAVADAASALANRMMTNGRDNNYMPSRSELDDLLTKLTTLEGVVPVFAVAEQVSADSPAEFDVDRLPSAIEDCARRSGDTQTQRFVAPLVARLVGLLRDPRLRQVVVPASQIKLGEWLAQFLGGPNESKDRIVIVDLALVPSDVMHVTVAVIARLLFEATQRYHKRRRVSYPTTLVLEEAHTFIQDGRDDPNASPSPVQMCRRIFERVAREGRKFGMGMVLSSQRPSEISPTVLSQCNTFLLHRLVNDQDQALVKKLVPDSLAALMHELPTLPSRHAILLGHASPIPKMVQMRELPEAHRPTSSDPPMWRVWLGEDARDVDWDSMCVEWVDPTAASLPPQSGSQSSPGQAPRGP
jgi:DNA helicase HerA-like ATPase